MKLSERLTIARLGPILASTAAVVLGLYFVASAQALNDEGQTGSAQFVDFTAFWAAAKLMLAGRPLLVFDTEAFFLAQQLPDGVGEVIHWFYPPHFLLLVTPFGLLPFTLAHVLFATISILVFGLGMRSLAGSARGLAALATASPAVVIGTMLGNSSVIWIGLFAATLAALEAQAPRRAGLLLAVMTVKPHLGLLIPLALLADRAWRTVVWAIAGTALLLALATLLVGTDYWRLFLEQLDVASSLMAEAGLPTQRMTSWYAWLRSLGLAHNTALKAQLGISVVMAGVVTLVWLRSETGFELRMAVLALAIALATPYSYHYDMALGVVALVLLARSGRLTGLLGRTLGIAVWLGPLPGALSFIPISVAQYGAPLLTLLLLHCLVMSFGRRPLPAPTDTAA